MTSFPLTIAVVGAGNVGGALARRWAAAGHTVRLGVRDLAAFKGQALLAASPRITAHATAEAAAPADVVLVAAVPQATRQIAESLGNTAGKVLIDAMNSGRARPDGYPTSTHALLALTGNPDVVKCFNTTGFENLLDPVYPDGQGIDMFVAGDSVRGKQVATRLALEIGCGACHDFGGNDKLELLESLALSWINLAIMQGQGRNVAFRLVRR